MHTLDYLTARGSISLASPELGVALERESLTFYCGFDPTAPSLHVGSLVPLMTMLRLARAGHKPILLLGTGTGLIGDPSGKSLERNLLEEQVVENNAVTLAEQILSIYRRHNLQIANSFEVVRNGDWLRSLSAVSLLRDIGKHISVNAMLAKESVRARIEGREIGISFTEFSYMVLQAYDFLWLRQQKNCSLQIGGSDQWGNISLGMDLIHRVCGGDKPVYGLTVPLLTNSAGQKVGKTEAGAIWLDGNRTSPYEFFQFWLNTEDRDVIKYLRLLTDVAESKLDDLSKQLEQHPDAREAQRCLAKELTTFVHGEEAALRAERIGRILFGDAKDLELRDLDKQTVIELSNSVPAVKLSLPCSGIPLIDALVSAALVDSRGAAKKAIQGGSVYLNNVRIDKIDLTLQTTDFLHGTLVLLRFGKRNYRAIVLE